MWNAETVKIISRAPVRIADLGGWSDTWFAGSGVVSNVAVSPGVVVTLADEPALGSDEIMIDALGVRRVERLANPSAWTDPFLASLLSDAPGKLSIAIESAVPPGSGLGTSASVAVAVLAAIETYGHRPIDQLALAHLAHRRETADGRQSGVQDHAAAAMGGVTCWMVDYPQFSPRERLSDDGLLDLVDARLLAVYLGAPHSSSVLHEMVISKLESEDSEPYLQPLREAALAGHRALLDANFAGYGQALVACHEGQRRLHPELISDLADHVVSSVALQGAAGWKVNGAGGSGGSMTVLCGPDPGNRERLTTTINDIPGARVLDLHVDRAGVQAVVSAD